MIGVELSGGFVAAQGRTVWRSALPLYCSLTGIRCRQEFRTVYIFIFDHELLLAVWWSVYQTRSCVNVGVTAAVIVYKTWPSRLGLKLKNFNIT